MFTPSCLVDGKSIDSPSEDLRLAKRVEQYRVSAKALYLPSGLRWTYIPLSEIREITESHRSVSAGKCVSVVERRPALEIRTDRDSFKLNLEKAASLETLLSLINPSV